MCSLFHSYEVVRPLSSFVNGNAKQCHGNEDFRVICATYLSRILISLGHWLPVRIYVQFAINDRHWFSPYSSSDSCIQTAGLWTNYISLPVITFMTNTCSVPTITGVKFKNTQVSNRAPPPAAVLIFLGPRDLHAREMNIVCWRVGNMFRHFRCNAPPGGDDINHWCPSLSANHLSL